MSFPVSIRVNASQSLGPLPPIYRFFGADEPNYAYMKDGKKLLSELGQLGSHQVYFRTHNLLVTGDGTPALKWGSTNAYTEDKNGKPVYDWTIVDLIFDTYLASGVKPYVQVGFMPQALSTNREPYQHSWTPDSKDYDEISTGWAYPPKDYTKWAELVYRWAKHCVERYGYREVETWYWEIWNEPNICYWRGSTDEFYALHDHAAAAIRRVLPTARIGGPETADGGAPFLQPFLEHCLHGTNAATGEQGSHLDFVSFHAKGKPSFLAGPNHVRMGISTHLQNIDSAFATISSFPTLRTKPIIIGESDPEGCAAAQGPQLSYRNGTMYSSYTAATFARKYDLAAKHGVNLEGALTWSFEFEDQPFFDGFRVLASNGIDLPVLNAMRMFARVGSVRLDARSSAQVELDTVLHNGVRGDPDVGVLASVDDSRGRVSIMVWHYHDDDVCGPASDVKLTLDGWSRTGNIKVTHFRIDEEHSNAFAAWKRMGSPQNPTADQYQALEAAGQLEELNSGTDICEDQGQVILSFQLPRQAVSLVILES